MRLYRTDEGKTKANNKQLLKNSLTWVEYLLQHGAALSPPLDSVSASILKSERVTEFRIDEVRYPPAFDLSLLVSTIDSVDKQSFRMNYRIKLAKLLIKYTKIKTNPQKLQKAIRMAQRELNADGNRELEELVKVVSTRI